MTDNEKAEIIADKLMGYKFPKGHLDYELFNPFGRDDHCMEAWDKFVMEHGTHGGTLDACLRKGKKLWIATTRMGPASVHPNRRTAMCDLMARTVT